ncbi:MAG: aconitate hydratase AcnA [Lentisphaerae bacterium]|nr:aconitate hydratase AcnA [Lentisphaerota bacterium]
MSGEGGFTVSEFDACLKRLDVPGWPALYYHSLPALGALLGVDTARLPYAVQVFLEMMVRLQGHPAYTPAHVRAMAAWRAEAGQQDEFPFLPSRVLLQDFTGVPCIVDLAAMRSALQRLGQDPSRIEPQVNVDLVIDHSVQIDEYRGAGAYAENLKREFERNRERYVFLRWGQQAFKKVTVLPPGLGICHQVNMEYIGRGVATGTDAQGRTIAYPDSCVGTDSHTPMINSMGVVGWGVGGIEAEAAMLGQPMPMLTPQVIGCRLVGKLAVGCTPTDAALFVTQTLRAKGVVEKFVEFFGPGLANLSVADRAPLANMTPEYGATMGLFPIDEATLDYLRQTGRTAAQIALVEAYCRAQGMFRDAGAPEPRYSEVVDIDLSTLVPSVAGPKRPQDRVEVRSLKESFKKALTAPVDKRGFGLKSEQLGATASAGDYGTLHHGSVVIAAITSCTNTSNPTLMIGAGLLAKKAVAAGLTVPAHVKTSFAPGSRVVTRYLEAAGLIPALDQLGFRIVAYGCTTCIGNSGPLLPDIEKAIAEGEVVAAAVLSGNRNFEGRIHPLTKANYLASPLLVMAYGLAGRMDIDLTTEPLGKGRDGREVFLKDIWPTMEEIRTLLAASARPEMYVQMYADVMQSSPEWSALPTRTGAVYAFEPESTYIREPPFFEDFSADVPGLRDIRGAAVLALLGDFITTDHISPAGSISKKSPAAQYLLERHVAQEDFNSYGSRRGNHEVMMRGTFANIRIRNHLVAKEGGNTLHFPSGEEVSIFEASERYRRAGTPLVVLAGKLYGAGSSRDWAAKGAQLLGVKAVIAESFERIHRSNLVGMGVLPLEFLSGASHQSLGLTGRERFTIDGVAGGLTPGKLLTVTATSADGSQKRFQAKSRADSALEIEYLRHGGILPYVLRQGLNGK